MTAVLNAPMVTDDRVIGWGAFFRRRDLTSGFFRALPLFGFSVFPIMDVADFDDFGNNARPLYPRRSAA